MLKSKIEGPFEIEDFDYLDGGDGVLMAQRQSHGLDLFLGSKFEELIEEIEGLLGCKAIFAQLNRMPPGCIVPMHTDTLKSSEKLARWHIALKTNELAVLEVRGKELHFEEGWWYGPIPYWEPHAVRNLGRTERIHFIVDLEN